MDELNEYLSEIENMSDDQEKEKAPTKKRGRPKKVTTNKESDSGSKVSKPTKRRGRVSKSVEASPTQETPEVANKAPVKRVGTLHDGRNLTKKGKESLRKKWSTANSSSSRHSMMANMLSAAREKFGVDKVFGSQEDMKKLVIGIPMPSLAMEYLLDNDVFPLSSLVMIAGPPGKGKSTLSYEIFRWFYELAGMVFHVDTELKVDYNWCYDIMAVPKDIRDSDYTPLIANRAESLEKYQDMLSHYFRDAQKNLIGTKEAPGPGKIIPCCFAVDSLAAAASEELQEKIIKEGHANRAHPVNALKNTHYLQSIKKQLSGWPFSLLVVNHLKEKTDDMGFKQEYTLGGQAYTFHESMEIRVDNWKKSIKTASFEGVGVTLKNAKNSYGVTGRRIRTRRLHWYETNEETGEVERVAVWDWNWAICHLLNEVKGQQKEMLKERGCGIKVKSPAADVECLANLPALGMGKDEYLPWQEVGGLIQDNEEVSNLIRESLQIQRRHQLDRPYDDIVNEHVGG